MDETAEKAAVRELKEETGLTDIILTQFKTYSAVDRDPRHRTISIVFTGIAPIGVEPIAGDDAKNAHWFNIKNLPDLAFDHDQIVADVLESVS